MYLLDTNVISETRRPARMHRNVRAWLEQTSPESLYTSVIVMMELERGVLGMERKDPAQGAILREWLGQVIKPAFNGRILPIDEATAGICAVCTIGVYVQLFRVFRITKRDHRSERRRAGRIRPRPQCAYLPHPRCHDRPAVQTGGRHRRQPHRPRHGFGRIQLRAGYPAQLHRRPSGRQTPRAAIIGGRHRHVAGRRRLGVYQPNRAPRNGGLFGATRQRSTLRASGERTLQRQPAQRMVYAAQPTGGQCRPAHYPTGGCGRERTAKQQVRNDRQLFRYGRKTLDTALQSQLSAHGFSQNLLDNQLASGLNLLNLYKAIGSGWQEEGSQPAVSEAAAK